MSNVLDETESAIIERRLKEEGVRIHYRCELDEVIGTKGRASSVHTKNGQVHPGEFQITAKQNDAASGLGGQNGFDQNDHIEG